LLIPFFPFLSAKAFPYFLLDSVFSKKFQIGYHFSEKPKNFQFFPIFTMPNFAVQESFAPEYVEVALPLPLRQTFTYRLPFGLRETVKIGARLLVPFGKRHLTGYAVALHRELSEEIEFEESAIKEAAELVDEETFDYRRDSSSDAVDG
jgi:hypothetical protein